MTRRDDLCFICGRNVIGSRSRLLVSHYGDDESEQRAGVYCSPRCLKRWLSIKEEHNTGIAGLLKIKQSLEQAIEVDNSFIKVAIFAGNYQGAANIEQQKLGKQYAIALVGEALEDLTDD